VSRPQETPTAAVGFNGGVGSAPSKGAQPISEESVLESLRYNKFAKFTQVEEAPLLWAEAAEQLAKYASEVRGQGTAGCCSNSHSKNDRTLNTILFKGEPDRDTLLGSEERLCEEETNFTRGTSLCLVCVSGHGPWRRMRQARMQVTAEGGVDAAQEAPFIFSAMDSLANRAASWAERRQRLLQERGIEGPRMVTPHDAALEAAAAVKEVRPRKRVIHCPLTTCACLSGSLSLHPWHDHSEHRL
jgi:hypothetical protein